MEENTATNPPETEKKGLNYSMYVIVIILILVVIIGSMYLYKKNSQQSITPQQAQPTQAMIEQATPAETMSPTTASSAAMNTTVQKITVTASNFSFDPKMLTVKKGQPVALTFKNSEGAHDFVIDEFTVKTKIISSGQSETVTFTPDKTGTFHYYCSVGNHRAMGMQGTITVE